MNHDCEIIQDLMPLVIDEVSSDKSRQAVEDHVKECPDCARIYEDLKTDLMEKGKNKNKESHNENRFIRTILKKKRFRRIRKIVLLVLLAVMLVYGAGAGVSSLYHLRITMSPDQYEIYPVQMKNGDMLVIMDYKELNGSGQVWGTDIYGDSEETYGMPASGEPEEEWWQQMVKDGNAVYIERADGSTSCQLLYTYTDRYYPRRTFLGRKLAWQKQKEIQAMLPASRFSNVKGYKIYKGDNELVWSLGDPAPMASEELEEYYRLYKIYRDYSDKVIDHSSPVRAYTVFGEADRCEEKLMLMRRHLDALEANIPELQPWIGEKEEPLDEETFNWAFGEGQ